LTLFGAPTDLGSAFRGSGGGPGALRAGGLAEALRHAGWEVADAGDVVTASDRVGAKIDGCSSLAEVAAACRAVRDASAQVLTAARLPLLLGGDHSLAIGSIAAASAHAARSGRPFFVLWLDAHADFNLPETSPSGCVFGMPVAVVSGEGHPSLLALGQTRPIVDIRNIALLGVRSVDPLEVPRVRGRGLRVHGMEEIRRDGMAALALKALEPAIRDGAHIHVSFDLDVLDPEEAPGVGLPEADGATIAQTQECLEAVMKTGLVGSFDLMEHNPGADPEGGTTRRVIALMAAALRR
jgi:arginase